MAKLGEATVTDSPPGTKPNSPFYVEAEKLAKKGDKAGLKKLDKQLDEAGYSREGQVRAFIAKALGKDGAE
jgi:hypothetical protein